MLRRIGDAGKVVHAAHDPAPVRCRHPRHGRCCSLSGPGFNGFSANRFRQSSSLSRSLPLRGPVASRPDSWPQPGARWPSCFSRLARSWNRGDSGLGARTDALINSCRAPDLVGISRLRREASWARLAQADTEARLAWTEQLYQLSSELSCSRTPAEVMATCLPELARAIDADTGAAFLLSVDSTVCELAKKVGYPELRTASAVALSIVERSPLNDAIRRRELLVVASDGPREVNHRAASETIPELREGDIVLPLITGGRVVGAMVLGEIERPHPSERRAGISHRGGPSGGAGNRPRAVVRDRGARPYGGRSAARRC